MIQRFWSWLERVPIADRIERRNAAVAQLISAIGVGWVVAAFTVGVARGLLSEAPIDMALVAAVVPAMGVAFALLRAGRYRAGLWAAVAAMFVPIAGFILPGLARGGLRLPLLAIPLTTASLLLGRRALAIVLTSSLATIGFAALRDAGFLGGPGSLAPGPLPLGVLGQGILTLVALAVVLDRFGGLLQDALSRALRREGDLKASEERFRLAFATSPDAMNIVRMTDGVYVEVNEAFVRFTGWRADEMIGRTSAERELWVDRDLRAALVTRLARGEAVTNVESSFRCKDGSIRLGLISVKEVSFGGVPHILAAVRDITDHRREVQERQALLEQLRHAQKLEAIGRLTGGVAHDFNNILTSMLSSAQLVKEELPAEHPARADVEQIEADARRAAELTRQLLAIARKHEDAPKVIRVEERARSLDRLLRRVMGASIAVETRLAEQGWPVFVDPGQVEQVILNLAVNARDAMPGGGRLTISTENVTVPEAPARAGEPPPGEYVLLTVADTGAGMPPEVLAHAFEPFFTTKGERGTGLGLATCAEIVRRAGGTMSVESAPLQGTRFRIHLPRAAATAGPPEAPQAIDLHGEETILLVEDEPSIRRIATRALEQLGYAVVDAASASEALAKAARHAGRIDCLVVDLELPDGSGREAASWILAGRGPVPALLVSGSPVADAERDRAGARFQFLAKPYTPIELARRVRLLLDGARAAGAAVTPDPTRSGSRTA
jgi:PAS domain S-box-containing protein